MTEKEYKKLISEIDITTERRNLLNEEYDLFCNILNGLDYPFALQEAKKDGLLQSQMAISSTNYFNILLNLSIENSLNSNFDNILKVNEVLKVILLNMNIKCYEINNNHIKIKKDNLYVNLDILNENEYSKEIKKQKFIEEINSKYTLFKNAYKLIRHLLYELNIEIIDDYTLFVILVYSLEKHYSDNKYDNYMVAFASGLDDFINSKKIFLQGEYSNVTIGTCELTKGYIISDPFDSNINLASNINDANIGEVRKLKKRISKLYEDVAVDNGSSSILTLNINPVHNNNGTISWSYVVVGRNLSNVGGEYVDSLVEDKSASLKAFFRGLKAIVSSNIYNKNITVVTKHKDILKCIEKEPTEAENNSRRKTITKYITDNKLIVSYQIKD